MSFKSLFYLCDEEINMKMPFIKHRAVKNVLKIWLCVFLLGIVPLDQLQREYLTLPSTQAEYLNVEGNSLHYTLRKDGVWEYISPIHHSSFSFDSLGTLWQGDNSAVISLRFADSGGFSQWQRVEPDYDVTGEQSIVFGDLLFVAHASQFQYKIEIPGKNADFSGLHTHLSLSQQKAQALSVSRPSGSLVSLLGSSNNLTQNLWNVHQQFCGKNRWICESGQPDVAALQHLQITYLQSPPTQSAKIAHAAALPHIISRAEWGADESLRMESGYNKARAAYCVKAPWACLPLSEKAAKEFEEKKAQVSRDFPNEVKIVQTIDTENGEKLAWPKDYMARVYKLVLHHTADALSVNDNTNSDDSNEAGTAPSVSLSIGDYEARLRSTYYYHTVVRGWGDIGYNYIIDGLGNIYEGRSGGDRVVGAHVAWNNEGSIGIALMGNYQEEEVSSGSQKGVVSALSYLSKKYNLDPAGYGSFRGKYLPNIIGHRDLAATACPGENFYDKIEKIRSQVSLAGSSDDIKIPSLGDVNQANGQYSAEYLSADMSDIRLPPSSSTTVHFRFKNMGSAAWDTGTYLSGCCSFDATLRPQNVADAAADNIGFVSNAPVLPGQAGDFPVTFVTGYMESFTIATLAPVIDGQYKVQSVLLPLSVTSTDYSYEFVSSRYPKKRLFFGEETDAEVVLKNTGNIIWKNSGENRIVLKPDAPRWRTTALHPEDPEVLATLAENEVYPGQNGHFQFKFKAPANTGSFEEHFSPYIKQVGYLADVGMYFALSVVAPDSAAQYSFEQESKLARFIGGEKKTISLRLTNRDVRTWDGLQNSDIFLIGFGLDGGNIDPKVSFDQNQVRPGESVTMFFQLTAPLKAGRYDMHLLPRLNGANLFQNDIDLSLYVDGVVLQAQRVSQDYNLFPKLNERVKVSLKFKNTGNTTWKKDELNIGKLYNRDTPGLLYDESWINFLRPATLLEKSVAPGETGTFEFYAVPKTSGVVEESFKLGMTNVGWVDMEPFSLKMTVVDASFADSGGGEFDPVDSNSPLPSDDTAGSLGVAQNYTDDIKIKLGYEAGNTIAMMSSPQAARLEGAGQSADIKADTLVKVSLEAGKVSAVIGGQKIAGERITLNPQTTEKLVRLDSWEHYPTWDTAKKYNDNMYRGKLTFLVENNKLVAVNELPLEDYIKGMAETTSDTHFQKRKTMSILARTYALFYLDPANRKFPGKYYDGSDDPNVFQKYLGYTYEQRSAEWVKAVGETRGMVVTYRGKLIKTPYFTQSDGRTRSAEEVWGWKDTPYLVSVPDPLCDEKVLKGHGVGLSGCGAEKAAQLGHDYEEIIQYYYKGVEVSTIQ